MAKTDEASAVVRQHHEQMLKLVAKGFYNELINYGVNQAEVLAVAGHLLDNVMQKTSPASKEGLYYNRLFTLRDVRDEWAARQCLAVHRVSLTPLRPAHMPLVAGWLRTDEIRESFYPPFPENDTDLADHFRAPDREYFCILYEDQPVGLMGAENIDSRASRLEMRKLIGNPEMHGKGIGKRATFLFLYHSFVIRRFNKVYLHSLDINIRNLNLNSRFGFELEGVFLEDAVVRGRRHDVVRMGLLGPVWLALFA